MRSGSPGRAFHLAKRITFAHGPAKNRIGPGFGPTRSDPSPSDPFWLDFLSVLGSFLVRLGCQSGNASASVHANACANANCNWNANANRNWMANLNLIKATGGMSIDREELIKWIDRLIENGVARLRVAMSSGDFR